MITLILDLDQFTSDAEETIIREAGLTLVKLKRGDVYTFTPPYSPAQVILRSERMESAEYRQLHSTLSAKGLTLVNSPEMSERASEFSLQYPLIQSASPRSLILRSDAHLDEVMQQIEACELRFPLFIKTERKSLKERSLVYDPTKAAIASTIEALNLSFGQFKTLVIKEVLPLDPQDSRGIVFRNSFLSFDTGPLANEADFQRARIYHFFYHWMAYLGSQDFANFYVMDVTQVVGHDKYIIVEIKDAQFTKIKNPIKFWRTLASQLNLEH
jgi:hypothetical protein